MNYIFIVLGVIVIILIYVIYIISSNKTTITSYLDLSHGGTQSLPINYQPISAQSTYNLLLFVNGMAQRPIFYRSNGTHTEMFGLTLHYNNGAYDLVWLIMNNGVQQRFTIQSNIGLQQWIYISICTSNTTIDFYINGKLTTSVDPTPMIDTAQLTNQVYFGNLPAVIQSFTYYPYVMSAADVYGSYTGLNSGANYLYQLFTTYRVNLSLSKNGTKQTSMTVL